MVRRVIRALLGIDAPSNGVRDETERGNIPSLPDNRRTELGRAAFRSFPNRSRLRWTDPGSWTRATRTVGDLQSDRMFAFKRNLINWRGDMRRLSIISSKRNSRIKPLALSRVENIDHR
jgi:hypothetical protein